MKKQFFRVKQLTDQRFFRAGKTEVLSDDLQEADRKVEYIRNACSNVGKKLGPMCSSQESSREKRLKKNPEHALGLTMQENGVCEEECLLSTILSDCGKIQLNLANEALDHELQVEQFVVTPLHQMMENEVPNIQKTKSKLAKLTLDMDSARTRYQTAVKHGSANVSSIKDELEDAEQKVEQCRDALASEMFQLISREADLAQIVVQYAKLQRAYHEISLKILAETIPELENNINDSPTKPMYGFPLEEHLRVTGRKVAFPIELCVCALLELGMEEEGLFRVAGSASKVRRMRMSFDACCLTLPTALEYRDPHVIAGALKLYLRELPEPLMTHSLYDEWMAAARIQPSNEARLQALKQVVEKLPQANFDNLQYLIKFLSALSRNQEVNKMTPQNIAIVIAPNLIWSLADETSTIGMNMSSANTYSFIVDNLVNHADWFFPADLEFFQTFPRETTLINGMTSSTGSVSGLQPEWTTERVAAVGHTRGSSGDTQLISLCEPGGMKRTQSSSSLSDHSSPPHGSPKPATRRKNKPAPIPPNSASPKDSSASTHDKPEKPPRPAVGPISSTLPRPSKKHSLDHEVKTAVVSNVENVPIVTMEKQQKSSESHRKHSTEVLDHHQNSVMPSSVHRRVSSGGEEKVFVDAAKSVESLETAAQIEQVSHPTGVISVTVTSGQTAKVSSTENCQQKSVGHLPSNTTVSGISSKVSSIENCQQKTVGHLPSNTSVSGNSAKVSSVENSQQKTVGHLPSNTLISGNTAKIENSQQKTVGQLPSNTSVSGNTSKASSGENSQQKSTGHLPSSTITSVTVTAGNTATVSTASTYSTLERKHPQRPVPVAAPRSSVNTPQSSENVAARTSSESEDAVVLRRPPQTEGGERSNKPAVPERPATLLRPHSSFRGSRHSGDSDTSSGEKLNSETKDSPKKSQSDLQGPKLQTQVMKEGSTSLVIPGPCPKGTFSTSTKISQS